jgi:hypothetical protein
MTEIFRTNILSNEDALIIKHKILRVFPGYAVNFDLDDCDHVLRVKGPNIVDATSVMLIVRENGFQAEILPDEVPALVS